MQSPNKTYAVYVPQGCAGRIHKPSSECLIDALHTDDFSSCIIICLVSAGKVVLIHADAMMINTIENDLNQQRQWLNQDYEIIILYRETGNLLLDFYIPRITKTSPNAKLTKHLIGIEQGEVLLSLSTFAGIPGKNIHPNIRLIPNSAINNRTDNLLHHPQEQQFLAVQKIEQVVGLRECARTKTIRLRNALIFSENHWIAQSDNDLKIDTSYALTNTEMSVFLLTDSYAALVQKIEQLIAEIKKEKNVVIDNFSAASIAFHLENYLHGCNNIDPAKLFILNMKDFILKNAGKPKTAEDELHIKKLNEALNSDNTQYESAVKVMETYMLDNSNSSYKKDMINHYRIVSKHYLDRQYYKKLMQKNNASKEIVKKMNTQAIAHYQNAEYPSALSILLSTFNKTLHLYLDRDNESTTAYYNLGRVYFKLGNCERAKEYLTMCVALRTKYNAPIEDKLKAMRALTECSTLTTKPPVDHNRSARKK